MSKRRIDWTAEAYLPTHQTTIHAHLAYDIARPYEVELTFDEQPDVRWSLSRELLRDGLLGLAGEGDVIIFPHNQFQLSITLAASHTGDPTAVLLVKRHVIGGFLAETTDLVPYGTERMDLEADLRKLLGA